MSADEDVKTSMREGDNVEMEESDVYTLDGRSLCDKLITIVDNYEHLIEMLITMLFNAKTIVPKQVVRRENKSAVHNNGASTSNDVVDEIIGLKQQLDAMLDFVEPHQEREEYKKQLKTMVDDRDAAIRRYARELKSAETALVEATYQARQKLKAIRAAQENKVNTADVVRYAHLISRSCSVAAPFTWTQGDPSRPYPTELDFSVSSLMNARPLPITAYPGQAASSNRPPPPPPPLTSGGATSSARSGAASVRVVNRTSAENPTISSSSSSSESE